jgi:hypothetical protein
VGLEEAPHRERRAERVRRGGALGAVVGRREQRGERVAGEARDEAARVVDRVDQRVKVEAERAGERLRARAPALDERLRELSEPGDVDEEGRGREAT